MALADALETIATQWPQLASRVDPSDQRLVRQQLAAGIHGATWDPNALLRVILRNEPATHPAWRALERTAVRRQGSPPLLQLAAAAHLRLALEYSATGESVDPDYVERAAEARIWVVPMVPAGRDLPPHVLVLARGDERLAPRFQFEKDGRTLLRPVAQVNRILGVDDDPWGCASWWLSPHAALRAIPADEIRVGSEEAVLAAAAAILAPA